MTRIESMPAFREGVAPDGDPTNNPRHTPVKPYMITRAPTMTHPTLAQPESEGVLEALDPVDARLLEALQVEMPVCEDPWEEIGRPLALAGDEVLDRVRRLKHEGMIRQISPIFDSRALGYSSVLVAAKVAAERIEAAAAVINAHPGVSHNYQRDAEYNLWFTLAVPPGERLEEHLDRLREDAGLRVCRALPAIRTFHIGVKLDIASRGSTGGDTRTIKRPGPRRDEPIALDVFDKHAIRITQDDLPLLPRPFKGYCEALGVTIEQLAAWMKAMRTRGALRRFAAILHHRRVGFVANGMGVWQAPAKTIEQAGRTAGAFAAVTHCYERPMFEDWPYNLYTIIHARSQDDCEAIASDLAGQLKPLDVEGPRMLYSTREFKKQRVRYFV